MDLTPAQQKKQQLYRDARFTKQYDHIWQSVGKCVFCDLRDKYVLFEENGIVLHVTLYAYIDGHLLITPRRHVRSMKDLTQREWETVRKFSYIAKKLIRDVHGIKGMQFVQKDGSVAQSTVTDHMHFHCVPFDAPDLLQWNYRRLASTPLESAAKYKAARKKLLTAGSKFSQKYEQPFALPVVCDLLVIRGGKVLITEHKEQYRFEPDMITIPGGHVHDFSRSLEEELAREIAEETGLHMKPDNFVLLQSMLSGMTYAQRSTHLNARYTRSERFMWNIYKPKKFDASAKLTPGDDSKRLLWVPISEIKQRTDITPEVKAIILSEAGA